jgi:hypothetical protein
MDADLRRHDEGGDRASCSRLGRPGFSLGRLAEAISLVTSRRRLATNEIFQEILPDHRHFRLPSYATCGFMFLFCSRIARPSDRSIAMASRVCRTSPAPASSVPRSSAAAPPSRRTEPFRSAEDAWFWTMAALMARHDGARNTARKGRVSRPCEPDDVIKCLDGLYRRRRIDLVHARILRTWGERRIAPNPAVVSERCDWRLWHEALERLEWPLRVKGIVA